MSKTFWILFVGSCLVLSIKGAPVGLPPTLVLDLFPQTIINMVMTMSEEQRQEFHKLNMEYAGDDGILESDESLKMFEDMKKNHRELYDLIWPAVSDLAQKLVKMDINAFKFFDRYIRKAQELAPLLKTDKETAVVKLFKYGVVEWDNLDDDARESFKKEFPKMAHVFENTEYRRLAGI